MSLAQQFDDVLQSSHAVRWEDRADVKLCRITVKDGIPFMVLGKLILDCEHGVDRKKHIKTKSKNVKRGDHEFRKNRFSAQNTRKFGCKAQIVVRDVVFFPDFKSEREAERKGKARQLKEALEQGKVDNFQRQFHMYLPENDQHSGHPAGEAHGLLQRIDRRLIEKIDELVGEGVSSVSDMQKHIMQFLKHVLFKGKPLPPQSNRQYFPSDKTVRNHIFLARQRRLYSKCDLINLEKKVEEWKVSRPDDKFFLRQPGLLTGDGQDDGEDDGHESPSSLLYVHQSSWQRRLMERYGQIVLLDATYRTTKYALPLFFLVVKTNTNYEVVASFIVEDEQSCTIQEALKTISQWNTNWTAECFMTDNSEAEIAALQTVFPDSQVYLCDFHREQAWERWVANSQNGIGSDKGEVLRLLRQIAQAATEEAYEAALDNLHSSEPWGNMRLQHYFNNTWKRQEKMWVWAFRCNSVLLGIHTNNGIERQHRTLKHSYLKDQSHTTTLTAMVNILVEEFLPKQYSKYLEENLHSHSSYRKYSEDIPQYLHDRPKDFVRHCMGKISLAETYDSSTVSKVEADSVTFVVCSDTEEDRSYRVNFGGAIEAPSCECYNWARLYMPCKHMFAVINAGLATWDDLSPSYTQSPWLVLDPDAVKATPRPVPQHRLDQDTAGDDPSSDSGAEVMGRPSNASSLELESEVCLPCPLARRQPNVKQLAPACRELGKHLASLTYLTGDRDALHFTHGQLQHCIDRLSATITREGGLVLEPVVKKRKATGRRHTMLSRYKRLRKLSRGRVKNKWSRRVGSRASTMKVMHKVHVPLSQADPETQLRARGNTKSAGRWTKPKIRPDTKSVPTGSTKESDLEKAMRLSRKTVLVHDAELAALQHRLMLNVHEAGMTFRNETPRDGNCFFHAVSDQLKRLNAPVVTHEQLRALAVQQMETATREQTLEWSNFVHGQTWQEYKANMATSGEYADELTIRVLAHAIGHPLHIVMSSAGGQVLDENVQIINEAAQGAPLLLGHYHENHYQSLDVLRAVQRGSVTKVTKAPQSPKTYHLREAPPKKRYSSNWEYQSPVGVSRERQPKRMKMNKDQASSNDQRPYQLRKQPVKKAYSHEWVTTGPSKKVPRHVAKVAKDFSIVLRPFVASVLDSGFAELPCESLLNALHISDSWELLEETAKLLVGKLPTVPKHNASLRALQSRLPSYGDGYAAYIPQHLVDDFVVKSSTFPGEANSVFTETSLCVYGGSARPNLVRLMAVTTCVTTRETLKKKKGISCEELKADMLETCREDYNVTKPIHYHCLSTALRRDIMVHSRVDKEDIVFHYTPTAGTSSGGIIELLQLPIKVGNTTALGLVCLDVKSPTRRTTMEACGAAAFKVCLWEGEQVAPQEEWLRCDVCHQRYHTSCVGSRQKSKKSFHCGCSQVLEAISTKEAYKDVSRDVETMKRVLSEMGVKSFVESVCSGVCRSWRMTVWNSGTVRRRQELKDRMFGFDCPENLLDWLFDFLYHDVFEKTIPKTEAVSVFDVYLPEVLVWFIMQQLGVNRLQAELIISRT